jgi:GGDEF domain-containing protein
MNNEKIPPSKLDIILEKKKALDATILEYEKRIDEKLGSISKNNPDFSQKASQSFKSKPAIHDFSTHDFLSGIDISDDNALDQAVRNSKLQQSSNNQPILDETTINDPSSNQSIFSNSSVSYDTDELPTISSVLGRPTPSISQTPSFESLQALDRSITSTMQPDELDRSLKTVSLEFTSSETKKENPTTHYPLKNETPFKNKTSENKVLLNNNTDDTSNKKFNFESKNKKSELKQSKPAKGNPHKIIKANKKANLIDMISPSILFIFGLGAFGAFLILGTPYFNFIDYSVLFILFTCLIFTIAMPYGVSLFFMTLILCSYVALSLISFFYLELPLELYQIGWIIVIPLLLWSSALLISKIKNIFGQKKILEAQIKEYDEIDKGSGLTPEKAYYKDLNYAMDRASKGESILTLEMLSINHLETLKSISGPRLWDEILYKTLNIIKKQCYNTHLIYVLEGNIFSIIMENTALKDQLLINEEITEAFNTVIKSYDTIDTPVLLNIVTIPYSRDLSNPFEYRELGLRHLKK